jgi:uncharacterized membrane protein YidH (DUF202 family)
MEIIVFGVVLMYFEVRIRKLMRYDFRNQQFLKTLLHVVLELHRSLYAFDLSQVISTVLG